MAKINYQDIDVEQFLQELGMRNVKRDGNEVLFSCPFPGHNHGDANPSASMQKGSTKTHCFGCGWSGNALTFVADLEQISPLKAARFIREWMGAEFKEPETTFYTEIDDTLKKYIEDKKEKRIVRNQPLDIKELEKRKVNWLFQTDMNYLFERGFLPETLQNWNIGWDEISRRFTIPYFNGPNGEDLIGFKGRALPDEIGKDHARYKVLGGPEYGFDSFDVSLLLFGQHKLKDWDGWTKTNDLFVVEGEFNVLAMWQNQIGPSVGISGQFVSDTQSYLIRKLGRKPILIFDDVHKARKAADSFLSYGIIPSIVPPHDEDPADMIDDRDAILDLIYNKKSAIIQW